MEINNARIETFDSGDKSDSYRMIITDVVLDNNQVVEDVAEYVNENYELEFTDSNLEAHEDRLTSEQIYELKPLLAKELVKILKQRAIDLIDEIVAEHITNINDYDTVQEFLNSIKQALCDGEYLATLDTDEYIVEQAYTILDNNEYELKNA